MTIEGTDANDQMDRGYYTKSSNNYSFTTSPFALTFRGERVRNAWESAELFGPNPEESSKGCLMSLRSIR
jgi:hypothetical protein